MCLTSLAFHNILTTDKVQSIPDPILPGGVRGGWLPLVFQGSGFQFSRKDLPNRYVKVEGPLKELLHCPLSAKISFPEFALSSIILLRDGR